MTSTGINSACHSVIASTLNRKEERQRSQGKTQHCHPGLLVGCPATGKVDGCQQADHHTDAPVGIEACCLTIVQPKHIATKRFEYGILGEGADCTKSEEKEEAARTHIRPHLPQEGQEWLWWSRVSFDRTGRSFGSPECKGNKAKGDAHPDQHQPPEAGLIVHRHQTTINNTGHREADHQEHLDNRQCLPAPGRRCTIAHQTEIGTP